MYYMCTYTYTPNVAYIRRPPKDYKVVAILSALFCFLPLGIFSIYYSYKVNLYYSRGELTSANRSSERTRLLIQLTVITGCVLWFAGILALLYVGS
ncbi:hypothetical protein FSP39_018437 [Pinctada imbricata]|uniref:Uncharacterized protein n=1 Tax=Pinctada imbricata TaxID=66713 RepID=A0AA88XS09_PINIB|nr:hypothetical protein FSP39_018437 [Pinctada imbricata]